MVTGDQVLREGLRWSGGLFSPDSGVLVVGLLVDVLRFLVDPRTGLLPMVDVGVAANGQCKLQRRETHTWDTATQGFNCASLKIQMDYIYPAA